MNSNKRPNEICIGNAIFKYTPRIKVSQKILTQRVLNVLQEKDWKIQNYYQQKWDIIFSHMIKSDARVLALDNINVGRRQTQCAFLMDFIHVDFYSIQMINLYKCNICSIECLAWLNAPSLRSLQLIYNHIKTFKSLQKSNFMLEKLYIYTLEKMGADLTYFSRVDQRLQVLGLEFNQNNEVVHQDLSFLSKVMFNHYRSLEVKIGFVKRIRQRKVQKVLRQRFKNFFQFHQNPNEIQRYQDGDTRPIRRPQRYPNQHQEYRREPQYRGSMNHSRGTNNYNKKWSR